MVFQCSFRVALAGPEKMLASLIGPMKNPTQYLKTSMKRQQLWNMMLLLSFNDQPTTKIGYCLRKSCTKRLHNYSWHRICLVTFHDFSPKKTLSSWKTSWKPHCYHCSDDVPMILFLLTRCSILVPCFLSHVFFHTVSMVSAWFLNDLPPWFSMICHRKE